jgi:uncharacterized protein YciI
MEREGGEVLMRYFVMESIFENAVNEAVLCEIISGHHAFLNKGFEEGRILFSGPKAVAGTGGFAVLKGDSLEEVTNYFSKDPLKTAGVATYRFTEFKLYECQPMLKGWFE